MPVFLVRAQLPELDVTDLRAALARVVSAVDQLNREGFRIRYRYSTYIPSDSWLGCLYEADTRAEVKLATERAVMPFDDIVEAVLYGDHAEIY